MLIDVRCDDHVRVSGAQSEEILAGSKSSVQTPDRCESSVFLHPSRLN